MTSDGKPVYNSEFMPGLQLNSHLLTLSKRPLWVRLLLLYALYVVFSAFTHLMEDGFQASGFLPSDDRQDPSMLAMGAVTFLTFCWTLLATACLMTLNARLVFQRPFLGGGQASGNSSSGPWRSLELIILESIRAFAATLLRLPLLILPGLFEWIRLAPIPFIVLMDLEYQKGERDALQTSRKYFRDHPIRVISLLVLALILFLIEFTMTTSPSDALPLWQAPIQHMASIVGFSILHLAVDLFTFEMYRRTFPPLTASTETMSNKS